MLDGCVSLPQEALECATVVGADLMDMPVGKLEEGMLADLLLIDGAISLGGSRSSLLFSMNVNSRPVHTNECGRGPVRGR